MEDIAQRNHEVEIKAIVAQTFSLQQAVEAQILSQQAYGRGHIMLHIAD